jgi:hypothetical protein
MRKAVSLLATVALMTALASAQTPEWADKLFAKDGTSHNFGTVARGAVLSHRFTMTNIYAVPLQITNTRTSCGCVTVTPSVQVLQPRETAYLDVTMDGRRFSGAKSVSIYVSVGPQFTSTATLQVSANSRTDVVFNPGQVSFNVVAAGQTPTQSIDVEYAGSLDWKITGVAEHTAPLETKLEEKYRQAGPVIKVGYTLSATLKASAPPGTYRWELLLETNDPGSPKVPVLVEATIQAPLSVVPAGPVRLTGKVGMEVATNVVIRGSKPFRILGVEGQADGLAAEVAADAKPTHLVKIKWQAAQAGELRRELRFKTDLDGATVTVPVEGTAAP